MLKTKGHYLWYENPDTGELAEFCEEVGVLAKRENLLTGEIEVEIGLWKAGEQKRFCMKRGNLSKNRFMPQLLDQGLSVLDTPENAEEILDVLLETERVAPTLFTHQKLGFCQVNGKQVFLADNVIGDSKLTSNFYQPEVTAPCGTFDSWKVAIGQEVVGHTNLELALAIGLSAPIVHLLRESKAFAENPVWGFIGASSTGKTTALRLIASIYGSPEESRGLIGDLNVTESALFARFNNRIGLPLIVDEATSQPQWDFTKSIYNFSKGVERGRCDSTGRQRERLTFSGPVIISGEHSILEQSMKYLGLFARCVELKISWTDDADHARRVSEKFRQNYGTAVVPLAKSLLAVSRKNPNKLKEMFEKERSQLKDRFGTVSGEEERRLNMFATVIVAASIGKGVLGLGLHVDAIRDLLVDLHQQVSVKKSLAEQFYDCILSEVAAHGAHFPKAAGSGNNLLAPQNLWGEYSTESGRLVLWVAKETLEQFAQRHRHDNFSQLLPQLHEQGLLEKFGDRYVRRHRLGRVTVRCYCFRLGAAVQ